MLAGTLLLASPLATAADAALYEVRTPGYHLRFRTSGDLVKKLYGKVRLHCSDGHVTSIGLELRQFNRPIDERGRFEDHSKTTGFPNASLGASFKIEGRVTERKITGEFLGRERFDFRGERYNCWSGRHDDPEVRFRAPRQ